MCPVRDVPCRSGAGWPMPLLPALRTRRRDALQRVSAERGAISHRMFAAALRMSEADGTVASPPPGLCRSAAPPRGVRSRAARPGTDAARSQLSGTGRANMAEILACRGADAPTARPPLARQPLPRRAAFRCSPPFPVRCIPGGIPPYPAAKSRNRTFVPLPTTV